MEPTHKTPRPRHEPHVITPKWLFRKVERTLDAIQQGSDILGTIRNVAEHMTVNFGDELGILGGRVYRLDDTEYELMETFGSARGTAAGRRVPRHYAAIEAMLDSGLVVMDRNAPELDPELEAQLGTATRFAAVSVADGEYLISFDVVPDRGSVEDLRASLNIVRLAINQKLHRSRYEEHHPGRTPDPELDPARSGRRATPTSTSPASRDPPRRSAATSTTTSRSPPRCSTSRSPTPPATACRRRCRCATSTWGCAWG